MGALIGAAWAVGKSADEMEAIALRIKGKRAFLKLLDPVFPGTGVDSRDPGATIFSSRSWTI